VICVYQAQSSKPTIGKNHSGMGVMSSPFRSRLVALVIDHCGRFVCCSCYVVSVDAKRASSAAVDMSLLVAC